VGLADKKKSKRKSYKEAKGKRLRTWGTGVRAAAHRAKKSASS
jgi:hypothetical protein